MKFFKFLLALLRWGLRVATVIIGLVVGNFGSILCTLVIEVGLSGLSLFRFEADEIFEVITGFIGDDDVGYYEMNDNSSSRFFGYVCLIAALVFRAFLLIYCFTGGKNIIIPVTWF